jgi:hypothetical protein
MFEELTKRDVVISVIALIAATALTIVGTFYVLHHYVLDRPDPLYRQGGLKSDQQVR